MHAEALAADTGRVLTLLAGAELTPGFYLAGGTAAALHLGHRISHDLDWFNPDPINPSELAIALEQKGHFRIHAQTRGSLHGSLDGVRVSFLHYPYPLLDEQVLFAGVSVASLRDIALMKLSAIAGRGTRRDFMDLYVICLSGLPLVDLMSQLSAKFGPGTNRYHILKSLTYFADADTDPDPILLRPIDWPAVKTFFIQQAPALLDSPHTGD